MRKSFSLFLFFLLGCATLLPAACSLEPEAPVDERRSKDHGDPTRVVLTLRHGAWDGTNFTPETGETADTREQTITYALQPELGWAPLSGTRPVSSCDAPKGRNTPTSCASATSTFRAKTSPGSL